LGTFVPLRSSGRLRVGIGLHVVVNLVFAAFAIATGQVPGPTALAAVAPPTPATVVVTSPASTPVLVTVTTTVPSTTAPEPPATVAPRRIAAPSPSATTSSPPTTRTTATAPADGDRSVERFDRLAACESSSDPTAVNGPYRGAFQFLVETWHAAGGEGDPIDASYERQRAVAMRWAVIDDPAKQWPVCWPATA
jgi:hypothetical protein